MSRCGNTFVFPYFSFIFVDVIGDLEYSLARLVCVTLDSRSCMFFFDLQCL